MTRGEDGAPAFLSRRFSLASRGAFGAALGGGDGNDEEMVTSTMAMTTMSGCVR